MVSCNRTPETGGPLGQIENWVLELFYCLRAEILVDGCQRRSVSLVRRGVSWEGEWAFSPWLIDNFWEYVDLL
jgi:hypothetical protein